MGTASIGDGSAVFLGPKAANGSPRAADKLLERVDISPAACLPYSGTLVRQHKRADATLIADRGYGQPSLAIRATNRASDFC